MPVWIVRKGAPEAPGRRPPVQIRAAWEPNGGVRYPTPPPAADAPAEQRPAAPAGVLSSPVIEATLVDGERTPLPMRLITPQASVLPPGQVLQRGPSEEDLLLATLASYAAVGSQQELSVPGSTSARPHALDPLGASKRSYHPHGQNFALLNQRAAEQRTVLLDAQPANNGSGIMLTPRDKADVADCWRQHAQHVTGGHMPTDTHVHLAQMARDNMRRASFAVPEDWEYNPLRKASQRSRRARGSLPNISRMPTGDPSGGAAPLGKRPKLRRSASAPTLRRLSGPVRAASLHVHRRGSVLSPRRASRRGSFSPSNRVRRATQAEVPSPCMITKIEDHITVAESEHGSDIAPAAAELRARGAELSVAEQVQRGSVEDDEEDEWQRLRGAETSGLLRLRTDEMRLHAEVRRRHAAAAAAASRDRWDSEAEARREGLIDGEGGSLQQMPKCPHPPPASAGSPPPAAAPPPAGVRRPDSAGAAPLRAAAHEHALGRARTLAEEARARAALRSDELRQRPLGPRQLPAVWAHSSGGASPPRERLSERYRRKLAALEQHEPPGAGAASGGWRRSASEPPGCGGCVLPPL
eukprot:TRINITY_DN16293_c0_g1_i1.p1 TRINITY_DN16293_c0_g1~~TRINITY_DN16293_c0_g1_i1.p1  ORF type:complete len:611 (+),score=148.77 TRINITY_DN16293_c0_g1_i1:87-1835(+)